MSVKYQPDSEIKELITAYLGGDAQAGGRLLNQYDNMIAYYIKRFFTSHDLWVGWDCQGFGANGKIAYPTVSQKLQDEILSIPSLYQEFQPIGLVNDT